MKIKAIVEHRGVYSGCYTLSYKTPVQWMRNASPSQLYLLVDLESEGDIRPVDFTAILAREKGFSAAKTWDQITAKLTEEMTDKYRMKYLAVPRFMSDGTTLVDSPIRSKGLAAPDIISADHESRIKVNYGDHSKLYIENIYPTRRIAKDVIYDVSKTDINLSNTLPIVHGITCFPLIQDNRLYALDAATLTRNRNDTGRGHLLIDFSTVGGAEFVHFKECTGSSFSDITLPTGKSFTGKFVIMVIEGRWYLPGEFYLINNRKAGIDLTRYPSELQYLDRKLSKYEYHRNTTSIVDTAVHNRATSLKTGNNFFILINDPGMRMSLIPPYYRISKGQLKFPKRAGGLLLERATRSFLDYSRVEYTNHMVAWFPDLATIKTPLHQETDNLMQNYGLTYHIWKLYDGYNYSNLPEFVLLDLVGSVT